MEVRKAENGEVVYRDHLAAPVAALLQADYRNDGVEQLIAVGADGEVRGYQMAATNTATQALNLDALQRSISDLQQKKQVR